MHTKRLAVISYHTCPLSDEEGKEVGGMNVYVLELAKELAKKGMILDLYTRSQAIGSEVIDREAQTESAQARRGVARQDPRQVHPPLSYLTSLYQFVTLYTG